MKKIMLLTLIAMTISVTSYASQVAKPPYQPIPDLLQTRSADALIAEAYKNQQSNLQIQGKGRVIKLLADDNQGSKHQRFIIALTSGHSLLIAHNIDLAPRINALAVGDTVEFYGEYEWNNKGGVIHWTHHDPDGFHEDGWLKHRGKIYQ